MEILIGLAVTTLVFGLFFLIFSMRGKSEDGDIKVHGCATCNCGKKNHQAHNHRTPIQ